MISLGKLCDISRGGSPRPIQKYITDCADGLNWIKIGDVERGEKYITKTAEKILKEGLSKTREVLPGDFLLSNSMSYGRPYITRIPGCIHDGWLMLRRNHSILDQDYLYHALNSESVKIQFAKLAIGAVVKNLNTEVVKKVEIPLPPLPEQRRIAAILDKAESLRAKRREALAHLDSLAQSIFLEMFGDPATNPKKWTTCRIGDLLSSASYGTSAKAGTSGEFPILRMNNIKITGEMDLSDLKFIDLKDSERERFCVRAGDIVFNRTNSADLVGKTAVYRGTAPMAYAGYLVRLRANRENDPEYIASFLNTAYAKRMLRGMCKSIIGMANINAQEVQRIHIQKPPLLLQRQYADRICEVETMKTSHRVSLAGMDSLFASLQHRAFQGEL